MIRQETGNYNKKRAPSFQNQTWGGGPGGGRCDGEQTLHTLLLKSFQGHPPSIPSHSVSCEHGSRDPGTQIRVTPWRLRGQINRTGCSDRGASGSTLEAKGTDKQNRLLRQRGSQATVSGSSEALRRTGAAILFEGMVWAPWQKPEVWDPPSGPSHPQAVKLGSALQPKICLVLRPKLPHLCSVFPLPSSHWLILYLTKILPLCLISPPRTISSTLLHLASS